MSDKMHLSQLKLGIFFITSPLQCSPSSIYCESVFPATPLKGSPAFMSSHLGRSIFLVSPPDGCFACSATADRYSAPACLGEAGITAEITTAQACLYRAVSQLVRGPLRKLNAEQSFTTTRPVESGRSRSGGVLERQDV